MRFILIIALTVIMLSIGAYWSLSTREHCQDKTIKEVVTCSDLGCAYLLKDGSIEANEKGFEVGDSIEVCRDFNYSTEPTRSSKSVDGPNGATTNKGQSPKQEK